MNSQDIWAQNGGWGGGQNRGSGDAMLIPNELVLTFGDCSLSVPLLVKIDQEMRPWECGQTQTGRQTDTRTDRDKLNNIYNLSHAICYRYGADNYFEFLFSFKTLFIFQGNYSYERMMRPTDWQQCQADSILRPNTVTSRRKRWKQAAVYRHNIDGFVSNYRIIDLKSQHSWATITRQHYIRRTAAIVIWAVMQNRSLS